MGNVPNEQKTKIYCDDIKHISEIEIDKENHKMFQMITKERHFMFLLFLFHQGPDMPLWMMLAWT